MTAADAGRGDPGSPVAAGPPAAPRPAATVAILRDGEAGRPEVLLTHRPPTMAFGPGLHVFPGGALEPDDADPRLLERMRLPRAGDPGGVHGPPFVVTAIREAWEETGILLGTPRGRPDGLAMLEGPAGASFLDLVLDCDIELRGDWLVPLSRWVTPPVVPRRYDARFFVAWLPDDAGFAIDEREVIAAEWVRPDDALEAMADGRIELWMPTSTTLQQLVGVRAVADLDALAPIGRAGRPVVTDLPGVDGVVTLVRASGAGGVPGAACRTWVVGRRQLVVVDPGDPSDEAADALASVAAARGGSIRAIAVTAADPERAAGGEGLALRFDVPLIGPAAAVRLLAAEVGVVDIGDVITQGDVSLAVVASPDGREDAVGYRVEGTQVVLGAPAGA